MTCPHAESTTLLWAYGEGPESHTEHVASCGACQAILETHETVQFHLSVAQGGALSSTIVDEPEIPAPANSSWMAVLFGVGGIGLAVAAVLLAWVGVPFLEPFNESLVEVATKSGSPETAHLQAKVYWDFDGFDDSWDDSFDVIEEEIALLEEELSTL